MKKAILTFSLSLSALIAFSQVNFYKFAVGTGFGGTFSYADVRGNSESYARYLAADYNFTPFIIGGIEYQLGEIFNFQTNFTFGEGLDGYNDPETTFENNNSDRYNLISFGIKYHFGRVSSSKKEFKLN